MIKLKKINFLKLTQIFLICIVLTSSSAYSNVVDADDDFTNAIDAEEKRAKWQA